MNTKSIITSLILASAFTAANAANHCNSSYGIYSCNGGSVYNVNGTYSSVSIYDSTVTNGISVNSGIVSIEKSKINRILSSSDIGSLAITNSTVSGKIQGSIALISITDSSVNANIDSNSAVVRLVGSNSHNITIHHSGPTTKVRLDHSNVNGTISFDGSYGEVCIIGNPAITPNIIHGTLLSGAC